MVIYGFGWRFVDLEHLFDVGSVRFETGFIGLGEHGFLEECWCF